MTFPGIVSYERHVYVGAITHSGRNWVVEGYGREMIEPLFPLNGSIGRETSRQLLKLLSGWKRGTFHVPDTEKPKYLSPEVYIDLAEKIFAKEGVVIL